MGKFSEEKQKGISLSLEIMFAALVFAMLLQFTTYTIKTQQVQKVCYNAFTVTLSEVSRWGGTQNKYYEMNGRHADLAENIEKCLRKDGFNISIDASPKKITKYNTRVKVTVTWTNPSMFGHMGKTKKLTGEVDSLVSPGLLL